MRIQTVISVILDVNPSIDLAIAAVRSLFVRNNLIASRMHRNAGVLRYLINSGDGEWHWGGLHWLS